MVQYCCVPLCTNSALAPDISFHHFPKDESLRKKWLIVVKRDERNNKKVSASMRVCSAHFLETDYRETDTGKRKCLQKYAIPSVFSFSAKEIKERRKLTRFPLAEKPQNWPSFENESPELLESTSANNPSFDHENESPELLESTSANNDASHICCRCGINAVRSVADFSTQKDDDEKDKEIEKLKAEVLTLKKTISDLKSGRLLHKRFRMSVITETKKFTTYYTGFDNIDVLKQIIHFLSSEETISFSAKLSVEDQMLLVFSKLRQNFDFTDLSFRFGISRKLTAFIFKKWINCIYYRLSYISIWPSSQVIFEKAPDKFKEEYPDTFMLLDATELKVQKPSSKTLQSQSYSNYKSTNTLKGLVGCDPSGAVIFVSQLFMGNISDKQLTLKSGLCEILEKRLKSGDLQKGYAIMADKGFNILKEVEDLGLRFNIPPMASCNQFEKQEVILTRKIASCRVHVERAIRRIKSFKIIAGRIPIAMLAHVNQIWTVCSILANFRVSLKSN